MAMNWVEIDRVLEELSLRGCFLQNIRQTSFHHLLFELYRPGRTIRLLICLERSALRLHETRRAAPSLPKPPRFASLLRARIKGCRVEEARQLGKERIVLLALRKGDARYRFYIRLWGGAANLILCDESGTVLDAFSRRPARGEIPGGLFRPEEDLSPAPAKTFALREDLPGAGESYNLALDEHYARQEAGSGLDQRKQEARRHLDRRENQYLAGLDGLKRRMAEYEKEEELRRMGDLLMGALPLIRKGRESYDPGDGGPLVPLDPRKSPVENAQEYYKRAGKASRGRERTREEIDLLETRLQGMARRREEIEQAETLEELAPHLPAAPEAPSGKDRAPLPGLSFRSGDFLLLAGRNAKENDALLRRHVRGNDYWLHTRDYAGGYIFIRAPRGKSVPLEVLLDAGNLALFYSKAKKAGQADVYYTQVKYLRRPKEGKKGLVLPTKEKNLFIKLEEERIGRLKESL